ncbi:hypothetical protein JTB14_006658 [Gonioctena quinquepunctata]|nr:hypothetical protein JTB14_006658 [Gonioctena quinquepunctata]
MSSEGSISKVLRSGRKLMTGDVKKTDENLKSRDNLDMGSDISKREKIKKSTTNLNPMKKNLTLFLMKSIVNSNIIKFKHGLIMDLMKILKTAKREKRLDKQKLTPRRNPIDLKTDYPHDRIHRNLKKNKKNSNQQKINSWKRP